MRYQLYGKKRKFSIIPAVRFVSVTFFFGTLIFCGFSTGSFMISYVTSSLNIIHPTSMLGIKDQEKCDHQCGDYVHNP
jgi:hypothetical protein